jgi:hypothetical protein
VRDVSDPQQSIEILFDNKQARYNHSEKPPESNDNGNIIDIQLTNITYVCAVHFSFPGIKIDDIT